MKGRSLAFGLALAMAPGLASAQDGLAIDHKAVGCLVAGAYPKLSACFAPAGRHARSRVYFRSAGTAPWYYVAMEPDTPCFSGILPKPSKALVGQKVEYYVEAHDAAFTSARTAEFAPDVVGSAAECGKDLPVAPFVSKASVAVFPSVPAGFATGGLGTAGVVGVAAAGTAVAGTAAAVAASSGGGAATTTTVVAAAVTTTTTMPAAGTTTTTTPVPPRANRAPRGVLRTSPDPPSGVSPLTVTFDLCGSTDPDGDPLAFFFDFGDGARASGACEATHTYVASSARGAEVRALATFAMSASVVDPSFASDTNERSVVVEPRSTTTTTTTTTTLPSSTTTTTTTTTMCAGPTVFFVNPANNACSVSPAVTVDFTATSPSGITSAAARADFVGQFLGGTCLPLTPVTEDMQTATPGTPPNYSATLNLVPAVAMPKCYKLVVIVMDGCGFTTTLFRDFVLAFSSCSPTPTSDEVRRATWTSDLDLEGGRMQVVVNGATASHPGAGRAHGTAVFAGGPNRVEATVVEAAGKAGVWRFEVLDPEGVAAGSIRVLAGEVVTIAGTAVTFRLRGTPGERIALTFQRR